MGGAADATREEQIEMLTTRINELVEEVRTQTSWNPGQNGPTPKRPQPKRPQPERPQPERPHKTIQVTETASQKRPQPKRPQPKRPHGMMEPNQNGPI